MKIILAIESIKWKSLNLTQAFVFKSKYMYRAKVENHGVADPIDPACLGATNEGVLFYRYFSSSAFVLRIPSSSFPLLPSNSIPIYPLKADAFTRSINLL